MTALKTLYGQFFTTTNSWLTEHVKEFIKISNKEIIYDPFAGNGDIFNELKKSGYHKNKGFDIDPSLGWELNDSLINIPVVNNSIIVTNPPYLTNYSASRKKINKDLVSYFEDSKYSDLYLIALERCLESSDYVVAIIPETFLNSNFTNKNRLKSVTILQKNPFADTDTPVCVCCFDNDFKDFSQINVYKDDEYINNLATIDSYRIKPHKNIDINFNDKNGWLGLRAVDLTDPNRMIKFDLKENIDYDWENSIKVSSRLYSLIEIDIPNNKKEEFIKVCNELLILLRKNTSDIIFSPFKGNMKNGIRRRRIDFKTARAIIEKAYSIVYSERRNENDEKQLRLF